MSTPFINPYETKDVVATSLNNLDKQSQNIISYLGGLFSSETVKDKQLILDDGSVETLKPFQVANSQGAFWDKGTTYYFQPVADRLREISLEIQGRLTYTDVSENLKQGLINLFSNALDDSITQVSDNKTDQYAADWTYEKWYNGTSGSPVNINDINDFFNAVGTAAFQMVNAASDENPNTEAIANNSGLKINVDLDGVAELIDDGDNFYNDNNDNGVHDDYKQPEFYIIGNKKIPVFEPMDSAPDPTNLGKYPGGTADTNYKQDLYNYQNKRIDPNSIYWNDPITPREPEEVFFDMVAIAITQQKVEGTANSAHPDEIRSINEATAITARTQLKNIAGSYFLDSQAWYDSTPAPSRNLNADASPTPPSFLLSKTSSVGTIDYSNYDGSYGSFKATDSGTLASLIAAATGISAAAIDETLTNWDWGGLGTPPGTISGITHNDIVDKITKYYTQSYLSASMSSTFGKDNAAISTKNFFLHEALNNLDPSQNPYLEEAGETDVVKFDKLLTDVQSGYLRSPGSPATTNVSNQMMQLMDLFLEDFDIGANRYVEDKRTLVDLFSGKLLKTAGENTEVQKSLFQNINSATKDISSQIKNTLTRGIDESAESQFTLDLFNQTAVRKEDYGLSPNPADPSKNFLPSYWENVKDKYLPAMYYYDPNNLNPSSGSDEANNTLNGNEPKNGLPAGFPVMDVRDFDQFFKATKLALTDHIKTYLDSNVPFIVSNNLYSLYGEMGSFLTDATTIATYPNWIEAGFTANSEAAIFGDLSDQTNFSRAIQLYKSLDKIIVNMEDRVSSTGSSVPNIPRPINPTITPKDPVTGLDLPPVTLNLSSTIPGYGNQPSPSLVKNFLEMHENTRTTTASPENSLQQISYLINTFDDYSKFSQNNAFETIYAGEVFEADKQNFSDLNTKRPEPGPDGSMPEDKSIPKPLMSALSSSVLISKIGQVLVNKVNDLVSENDVTSINNVSRTGPGGNVGDIDIANTTLSGSKESQIYLTNILNQASSISTGNFSVDVSAVGNVISNEIEVSMRTLITQTDKDQAGDDYRMVFIDDGALNDLKKLQDVLGGFNPTGGLGDVKSLLLNVDLDSLKLEAYPPNSDKPPGYIKFKDLISAEEKNLINAIRDGSFSINGSSFTINGVTSPFPSDLVQANVPDNILNTLGSLAGNIQTMIEASQNEQPARVININTDPILSKINNAKLNFANLTASPGANVSYNAILNADVYEAGPPSSTVTMASLLRSDADGGNSTDRMRAGATIQARKDLLAGLLKNNNKEIGGVLISNLNRYLPTPPNPLNTPNTANPYRDLLNPTPYTDLDPANLATPLPSSLDDITTKNAFQTHLDSIEKFINDVEISLTNAKNETPPRNITLANDPILALSQLAQLDLTALKDPNNSIWAEINDPSALTEDEIDDIKQKLIDSDVGADALTSLPPADQADIKAAREKLLEFFLEGKRIDPDNLTSYTIANMANDNRYKNLISPVTSYTYPANTTITVLGNHTESTTPLSINLDNSKADSFTLREIMGCDKDFTDNDVAFRDATGNIIGTEDDGFPNSLSDLEFKMRNVPGEFSIENKKLYVRKMQHFNVLFNSLSGGTAQNPVAFTDFTPELFGGQNLKEYIESLATSNTVINSPEFQNIVTEVTKLAPITENINALEVSLAGEIKKPKSGPESEIYSTLHLLTQVENQTASTPADYEAGVLQLLNQRNIKDGTNIIALEHRAAIDIAPQDGLYQYSGYAANMQYLDPANPLSISGPNIAPATTDNQGWNILALIQTKGIASEDFPPFAAGTNPSGLTKARDFLVALNEVYKDMKASKSPVIKAQVKTFDLWLRNNSFSPISDAALGGKDSLEADINILDHIQEGGGTDPATINTFLTASKTAAATNKKHLEELDDLRAAGKGFGQRIDDGLSASELRSYFQKNIFYPNGEEFPYAGPDDTRVDLTKDFFGRTLDNSNSPVFGVNIFGFDPNTNITHTVPPDIQAAYANANSGNPYIAPTVPPAPSVPDPVGSNSYKNFGRILSGTPVLDNPYEKVMDNINTLLTALKTAEAAGNYQEVILYKIMIKNLLGEQGDVPSTKIITRALNENPNSIIPNHPSLVDAAMGMTYGANNYPVTNLRTEILDERRTVGDAINPAKYKGTTPVPNATLANFALSSKADEKTNVRGAGIEGKSIQELAILLYIMQMFEQSNWDFEKYINDTSRYEIAAAVE